MRTALATLAFILSFPALAAAPGGRATSGAVCRHTTDYLARQGSLEPGRRLVPRKLTDLPPATTYMAVLRHIGGCESPLTMIDYRNSQRR